MEKKFELTEEFIINNSGIKLYRFKKNVICRNSVMRGFTAMRRFTRMLGFAAMRGFTVMRGFTEMLGFAAMRKFTAMLGFTVMRGFTRMRKFLEMSKYYLIKK